MTQSGRASVRIALPDRTVTVRHGAHGMQVEMGAAAIWHAEGTSDPVTVCMPGGDVTVSGDAEHLLLEGPVAHVFAGDIELE